jgi:GTP cyclohydrolase I
MITSGKNEFKTQQEKEEIKKAAELAYGQFLTALNYDWEQDPNMRDTPKRVAKMFVEEIGKGAYLEPPKITVFDNVDKYDGMVFQGNIEVKSFCSHHIMPFFGKAHVAYIPDPNGKICGLSKLNRVVEFFSRRPQVQENLTTQISDYLTELLPGNKGIAVVIEAGHTCVSLRGVNQDSTMKTSKLSGAFLDDMSTRKEFFDNIKGLK